MDQIHDGYADAGERLEALLNDAGEEALKEARVLTHSIRGMAANLSAKELTACSAALEKAILAGQERVWQEGLTIFRKELRRTLRSIEKLRRDPNLFPEQLADVEQGEPLSASELRQQVLDLYQLIRHHNFLAKKQFSQLKPALNLEAWNAPITALEKALGHFNYIQAQKQLEKLAEAMGITLERQ